MQRVLAAAAAVAMVVVALLVRGSLDDAADGEDGGQVTVVCAPDFEAACQALGPEVTVVVQAPADTVADLAAGTLSDEVDGWFTTSAWLEVATARDDDEQLDEGEVLARTDIVGAAATDRVDAVRTLCGDAALWRCLGDHAGEPWAALGGSPTWGTLRTGLPDADGARGLAVLGSVAIGYFGNAEFAANEFDDGSFGVWLGTLVQSAGGPVADALTVLATRPGTYSAAGGTMAQVSSLLTRPVVLLEPSPPASVAAVLVPLRAADRLPSTTRAQEALEAEGWTRASGTAPLLLKPGVLAALHTLWTEVR